MKISISSISYDINGSLLLSVNSTSMDRFRRVSRTATLDGSSAFYDTGYSIADATLNVVVTQPLPVSVWVKLCYFFETYPFVHLSTEDGFFVAKPEKLSMNNHIYSFSFLLKEKLN